MTPDMPAALRRGVFSVLIGVSVLAASATPAFAVADASQAAMDDPCSRPPIESASSPWDLYRLRCDITPIPDPYGRTGASYEISLFVGLICPKGQGDEFCLVRASQPIAQTGGFVDEDSTVDVTPGQTFPVKVCIENVDPCIVDEEVPLTFTLRIFGAGSVAEAEIFVVGGNHGTNPPQLCVDFGTTNCTSAFENLNFLTWVW